MKLSSILDTAFERVRVAPEWIRPALIGALLIYAFMVMRGGLILLPILFAIIAIKQPQEFLPLLFILLVVVPGAGFGGGLAYKALEPVARRLGRPGRVIQFIAGTWVYTMVLVFFVIPKLDSRKASSVSTRGNLVIATAMALFFGTGIGIAATKQDEHETA